MKKSIVTFIIGLLVGTIIATGAFYVYTRSTQGNGISLSSMGEPQQQSDGSGSNQPPDKPDGNSSKQPPEKPNSSSDSASQSEG